VTKTALVSADPAVRRRQRQTRALRIAVLLAGAAFAIYSIVPQASGLHRTLRLAESHPAWVAVALVASAIGMVAAAVQLIGSTDARLGLVRTTRVQFAAAFADLTAPAGLGRFGVEVRYLTQSGVAPADATASVALDALGGVATHALLIGMAAIAAGSSDVLSDIHLPSEWAARTWLIVGAVAVLAVIPVVGHRWRSLVDTVHSAAVVASKVLRRPTKVGELIGGAASVTVLQIVALAACAQAFSLHVAVYAVALVYLVGGGVASLSPTPGGLGAVEAALVAGLVSAGAQSAGAVAAILVFRLVTFWAPLVPGAIAFVDLRRGSVV
jgi:uncharacterized membrane protein YbhN (UPF0104 family)